eukprot:GHUV01037030.1.p1 GENE.GHUV01037030.1~~GHUV01037030.1.p1  ORF type:complete len:171 (-),score=20.20 GHUV01037030.1:222-734(-)
MQLGMLSTGEQQPHVTQSRQPKQYCSQQRPLMVPLAVLPVQRNRTVSISAYSPSGRYYIIYTPSQTCLRCKRHAIRIAPYQTWSCCLLSPPVCYRCHAAAPPAAESLIPETLERMQQDAEFQATLAAVQARGQAALTREEAKARRRSLAGLGLPGFHSRLQVGMNRLLSE